MGEFSKGAGWSTARGRYGLRWAKYDGSAPSPDLHCNHEVTGNWIECGPATVVQSIWVRKSEGTGPNRQDQEKPLCFHRVIVLFASSSSYFFVSIALVSVTAPVGTARS